ncbi:T4S1 protein, partial [Smithornis capensis]|nr:T4S1 protein [Smithornis capensis]
PFPCRADMCVGKCSRIVGPCLLALGVLSMAANILLLFPGGASKYLLEGHISRHALAVPGVWGGGIPVLLAATHITALGWRCTGCSGCGTPQLILGVPPGAPQAFISTVLSKLAFLGAAACFVLSGVGLTNGPLCFYNASEHGLGHGAIWHYPFPDTSSIVHLLPSPPHRAKIYLYNWHTWSICLEPEGIVAWNVVLFSLLLLISVAEMALTFLQIINGCLGCLCGFCEGK